MTPLVSVIWNGNHDQAQSMKSFCSVLNQEYENIELLITRRDYELLKEEDLQAQQAAMVILPDEDGSISKFRNRAIEKAAGEYICFLSAPQLFANNKTLAQVEYLERHPDINALSGGVTILNGAGEVLYLPAFVETDPDYIPYALKYGHTVSLYSMIFLRRKILEGACWFDDSECSESHYITRFSELYPTSGLQGEFAKIIEPEDASSRVLEETTRYQKAPQIINESENMPFLHKYKMHLAYRNSLIRGKRNKKEIRDAIQIAGQQMLWDCADLPLVSVIIPTYNRSDRILRAIESVLHQTYENIEVIIVDDCSSDDTAETIKQFALSDSRIKYFCLDQNSGPSKARNVGAEKASGEYIAFHDDDDEWFFDKLDFQMSLMLHDPAIDMTFGQMARYDGDNLLNIVLSDFDWYNRKNVFFQEELRNNYIGAPTIVMKKEKFTSLGGFCEQLSALEDWEFAIRASQKLKVEYINTPLMEVNVLDQSVTRNIRNNVSTLQYIARNYYAYADNGAALMNYYRKQLREMLKNSNQPAVELAYFRSHLPRRFFGPELAEELFFDTDEFYAYARIESLEKRIQQQQIELQRQYDRNEEIMAELQRQYDRNEEIMAELQRQYDKNKDLLCRMKSKH